MKYIIIPARGGSKGIPNKNLKLVSGISLVGWSVIHGKHMAGSVGKVVVSSDSDEILSEAIKYGADALKRPKELSGDLVFTEPVMDHAISQQNLNDEDLIILLQPTSPLRFKSTINSCIESVTEKKFDSSLTLRKIHLFRWKIKDGNYFPLYKDRPRRQDMEEEFCETGSVYVTKHAQYKKSGIRLSGKTDGIVAQDIESVDVDSKIDLEIVRSLSKIFLEEWKPEIENLKLNL